MPSRRGGQSTMGSRPVRVPLPLPLLLLLVAATLRSFETEEVYQFQRIFGGKPSRTGVRPYVVSLGMKGGPCHWCGGAILSSRWVLTAAHCVFDVPAQKLVVRAGSLVRCKGRQTVPVTRAFHNHNFSVYPQVKDDIALLRLGSPLAFDEFVQAVSLPVDGEGFSGKTGVIAGWGSTKEGGVYSPTMREARAGILPDSQCQGYWGYFFHGPSMICAGLNATDSCRGDSGGPLVVEFKKSPVRTVVGGIVSWGIGCGRPNRPGVYTDVAQYVPWITKIMDSYPCGVP